MVEKVDGNVGIEIENLGWVSRAIWRWLRSIGRSFKTVAARSRSLLHRQIRNC